MASVAVISAKMHFNFRKLGRLFLFQELFWRCSNPLVASHGQMNEIEWTLEKRRHSLMPLEYLPSRTHYTGRVRHSAVAGNARQRPRTLSIERRSGQGNGPADKLMMAPTDTLPVQLGRRTVALLKTRCRTPKLRRRSLGSV
jgi:hypothetical protein